MHYIDRIYGAVEISEPVLSDLIASDAMQRLHGVLQHGISGLIGVTNPTTRFEHSLGVYILVRSLGGGLEEQIAALLHDVSHTAFSHVIDYVFGSHDSQSYHEDKKVEYLNKTDVPEILSNHDYDWCELLCLDDEEMAMRYPTLEQPAPALCADRLDYFLRDSLDMGLADTVDIQAVLEHLVTLNGLIVVDDLAVAGWMGRAFIAADHASWANFREVGLYELAALAIQRGLQLGVISEADFWSTDLPTWEKLHSSSDSQLQSLLKLVSPETEFVWDEQNPTFHVGTKLRTIDPGVLRNGTVKSLSALDPVFSQLRDGYLAKYSGKWPMRVIPAL